jgi:hypothetical protein
LVIFSWAIFSLSSSSSSFSKEGIFVQGAQADGIEEGAEQDHHPHVVEQRVDSPDARVAHGHETEDVGQRDGGEAPKHGCRDEPMVPILPSTNGGKKEEKKRKKERGGVLNVLLLLLLSFLPSFLPSFLFQSF